jgi:hypothetical protein
VRIDFKRDNRVQSLCLGVESPKINDFNVLKKMSVDNTQRLVAKALIGKKRPYINQTQLIMSHKSVHYISKKEKDKGRLEEVQLVNASN